MPRYAFGPVSSRRLGVDPHALLERLESEGLIEIVTYGCVKFIVRSFRK